MAALAAEELALLGSRGLRYLPRMTRALRAAGRLTTRSMRFGGRALRRVGGTVRRNPLTSGLLAAQAGELVGSRIKRRRVTSAVKRAPRKAMRPPTRTTYRPTRAFAAASTSSPFRRGRKPSMSTKFVKRHYDDYGAISRNHSLWAGFQTHGSRSRLAQIAAEAILRALLSRAELHPSAFDQVFTNGGPVQAIKINWKWTNIRTGDDVNIEKEYVVGGRSFETIATDIANDWLAEDDEVYQGVPSSATIFRNDFTSATNNTYREIRHVEDLDKMKLVLYAKQVVRVQNLTPNNAGTDATDVNGTNPIQGKIYEFTTPPRVREQIVETHTGLRGLQEFNLSTTGVLELSDRTETGVDGVIGHPPPAGGLFTNCRKAAVISIAAAGQKFKTTLFKFDGTLLEFAQKFRMRNAEYAQGQEYKKYGGGIFWMGLENKFRQGQDTVKIGFNRELTMMGRANFARHRPMLRHYEQTDLGDAM